MGQRVEDGVDVAWDVNMPRGASEDAYMKSVVVRMTRDVGAAIVMPR